MYNLTENKSLLCEKPKEIHSPSFTPAYSSFFFLQTCRLKLYHSRCRVDSGDSIRGLTINH